MQENKISPIAFRTDEQTKLIFEEQTILLGNSQAIAIFLIEISFIQKKKIKIYSVFKNLGHFGGQADIT